ncbi:MAG: DUF4114 domain-containing protein [Sedimentisphaerales bacterium]|nr:DUF4114 domain-containing protein [Sedimentisphaerales bacterium]
MLGLFWITQPAYCAYTDIIGHDSLSCSSLAQTLDRLYGLEHLTRIDDYDTELGIYPTDQFWSCITGTEKLTITVRSKDADFTHEMGLLPGIETTEFQAVTRPLSSHDGIYRFPRTYTFIPDSNLNEPFRFGLNIMDQPGTIWSSAPVDNRDGIDHMVTYQINGTNSYVIAWEDLSADGSWCDFDGDYNDLIVQVNGAQPVIPIPEPIPLILFASGGIFLFYRPGRRAIITS